MKNPVNEAQFIRLRLRAKLTEAVRAFFRDHSYWEVETPILASACIVDTWLDPFVTHWYDTPANWGQSAGRPFFLQTSPELAMKRLVAAGSGSIFQLGKVFRNQEFGQRHNPEFTMLEWYAVGEDAAQQMAFTEQLVRQVFTTAEESFGTSHDGLLLASAPFERLAYDAAFRKVTGTTVAQASVNDLACLAERHGLHPPASLDGDDRDGWLNYLLAELVEPHLGQSHPTFLLEYPASQAALARTHFDPVTQTEVAERFELYFQGVELCNGYHELGDVAELRRRHQELTAQREALGFRRLPAPEALWSSLENGFPPCTGVALGFDRLCMMACGATHLSDVLTFPFDNC